MYKDISVLDTSTAPSIYGFRCNMATNGEFKVSFMRCVIDSMTTYKVWGVCLSKMVQLKVRCFVLSASLDCKSVAALLPDRGDRNVNQL